MPLIVPKRRLIVPAVALGLAAPAIILAPKIADALIYAGVKSPSRLVDINALPPKVERAVRHALIMQARMQGMLARKRAAGETLSVVQTKASTTNSVTLDSAAVAGDLIVFWNICGNSPSTYPSATVPSGFSQIDTDTYIRGSIYCRQIASRKIAAGGETTFAGPPGTSSERAMAIVLRKSPTPIAGVTISSIFGGNGTDGNPGAQVINASAAAAPVFVFGGASSSGAVDPYTFSPAPDGQVLASAGNYFYYKIYNDNPQDTTIDMDDEGQGNVLLGFWISCS